MARAARRPTVPEPERTGRRHPGAAAVVLTNCEGAKDAFADEVRRLTGHPVALVGHFNIARMWDTTPVDVVNDILYWADGGLRKTPTEPPTNSWW
ncbi:hypothetical protein NKH18_48830 [Streptomyces sp. M10(2022)]